MSFVGSIKLGHAVFIHPANLYLFTRLFNPFTVNVIAANSRIDTCHFGVCLL